MENENETESRSRNENETRNENGSITTDVNFSAAPVTPNSSVNLSATQPATTVAITKELAQSLKDIPQKMAFKIGDVAEIVGVETYVLRYWETEFEALKPQKASNNQRAYLKKDVETALIIKKLLKEDRFSIEGARLALKQMKQEVKKVYAFQDTIKDLQNLQEKMRGLINFIKVARDKF